MTSMTSSCPCSPEFAAEVEACSVNCTCRSHWLSGGCSRCPTYGAMSQRLARAKAIAQQSDDALRVAALEVMKSYEAYVALGAEPGPDTTGAPPKPEDEWDEYDYMMIPRWRALKAALDAVRAGRAS